MLSLNYVFIKFLKPETKRIEKMYFTKRDSSVNQYNKQFLR